ncbi:hypothetical protein SAMN04488698_10635 [Candidatus Frackibacter sp. WG12]|nr:MAG: hypothetical protein AWU54_1618 [Candidatus Frackibacter sp. T328-2]SDC26554.1 hypothetical protein SAMN04515661_10534 [Candidatus Frackibacter sp. WG11]SEM53578.1 hypothetical protein SAMN04488698_10635 [Candidatus Frackibacter sp. WG12]SFL54927.1 hypothetical protein SAMN04488699_10560 [Candidatus Frackibacter sp. WG13]
MNSPEISECVLEHKVCTACRECDFCDLDSDKICDNCMKCIKDDEDFKAIKITDIKYD